MRVFLDTNVLASALTTRGLCSDLIEVVLQSHEMLMSDHVLAELKRILPAKLGQSEEVTDGFINLLRSHANLVTAKHPPPPLPDADDELIVASAIAGEANVFVTGDKALLELRSVENLPVVSPRDFWEILASEK